MQPIPRFTRRQALETLVGYAASFLARPVRLSAQSAQRQSSNLSPAQDRFLDELERRITHFFWEQADAKTGLIKDRSLAVGNDDRRIGSIAATGFGLTALCIAAKRGYLPKTDVAVRVENTLRFLWEQLPQEHGFFYHFVNIHNGEREFRSEVSSIDTAILLCGVLTCRQFFSSQSIRDLAQKIYYRANWQWMLNGGQTLSHGWKPDSGFLPYRWDSYCELMMLYLLAIGSPTFPISPAAWDAWKRPSFHYGGFSYIGANAPIFVHQYSQAWFDFRGRRDRYADYFENSIAATCAHRQFCIDLHPEFADYSAEQWGITASDSAKGYVVWGGPPRMGPIDGTLVPAACAGSIPFLIDCVDVLQHMTAQYGERIWKRYGFVDSFNPVTGWVDADVIGIDVGISMLMAENARSGFVWNTFMRNAEVTAGMRKASFSQRVSRPELRLRSSCW